MCLIDGGDSGSHGEALDPNEEIGSGGGSFDDDAGTDGFTSFGLSLFFLCFLIGLLVAAAWQLSAN